MTGLRITVSGYQQSTDFNKACNVVSSLNILYPDLFKIKILQLPNEGEFLKWRKTVEKDIPGSSIHTVAPFVWLNDNHFIGGLEQLNNFVKNDLLRLHQGVLNVNQSVVPEIPEGDYDYDLIVIGGGSGGISCSKAAAACGKKVALLDFVKPSPLGTKWGLGGTCVNVGCIPKKLMHRAAILSESLEDAKSYGWDVSAKKVTHSWEDLVTSVQNHIGSLNFGYRVQLREKKVKYINALGSFIDKHTIKTVDKKGREKTLRAKEFVIAVGGRPRQLSCPGAELAITSDDLFSLPKSPGKTLVIGASYVALECAGFLRSLKLEVSVMVRSILLRGFDQQMADKIGEFMEGQGVHFIRNSTPQLLLKKDDGRIEVQWEGGNGIYDTVIVAVGRDADTKGLNLDKVGVKTCKNGKLECVNEQTNVPNIYAVGDVIQGHLELTPTAIQSGKLLAKRLYGNGTQQMDYDTIATTVFTPLEYGCVGLSEEDARARYESVDAYHTHFTPLEWFPCHNRKDNVCYCKVIVDLKDNERVLGLHFLGPNAGEVTQGFGTAMKFGMYYSDLENTVGIHPTSAEEFTTLTVTKSSGESALKSGC